MGKKINPDVMSTFRERLARRGITKDSHLSVSEVDVVRAHTIPVVGNVHIPTGRVAKREYVDGRFRKLKF